MVGEARLTRRSGGLKHEVPGVALHGGPGGDGAVAEVHPLQLRRGIVDGGVHQGVAIVDRLPRPVNILYLRLREGELRGWGTGG